MLRYVVHFVRLQMENDIDAAAQQQKLRTNTRILQTDDWFVLYSLVSAVMCFLFFMGSEEHIPWADSHRRLNVCQGSHAMQLAVEHT